MEKFEEHDSVGIGMSISAMSVVFCGLILLFIAFKVVGKVAVNLSKRNAMKAKGIDKVEAKELSQARVKFMPLFLWHCTKCRMKCTM